MSAIAKVQKKEIFSPDLLKVNLDIQKVESVGKNNLAKTVEAEKAKPLFFLNNQLEKGFIDYALLHLELLKIFLKEKKIDEKSPEYQETFVSLLMLNPKVLEGVRFILSIPNPKPDLFLKELCDDVEKRLSENKAPKISKEAFVIFFSKIEKNLEAIKTKYTKNEINEVFLFNADLEDNLQKNGASSEESDEVLLQFLMLNQTYLEMTKVYALERRFYGILTICFRAESTTRHSIDPRIIELGKKARIELREKGRLLSLLQKQISTQGIDTLIIIHRLNFILRQKYPSISQKDLDDYFLIFLIVQPRFLQGCQIAHLLPDLCKKAVQRTDIKASTIKEIEMAIELSDLMNSYDQEKRKIGATTPEALAKKAGDLRSQFHAALNKFDPTPSDFEKKEAWLHFLVKNSTLLTAFKAHLATAPLSFLGEELDFIDAECRLLQKYQFDPKVIALCEKTIKALAASGIKEPQPDDLKASTKKDKKRLKNYTQSESKEVEKSIAERLKLQTNAHFLILTKALSQVVQLSTKAAEVVPSPVRVKQICSNNCGSTSATSYCANCHITAYCSKGCQRNHWPMHKPLCKVLKGKSSANLK